MPFNESSPRDHRSLASTADKEDWTIYNVQADAKHFTHTNGSCASLNRDLTANSTFTLIEHLVIVTSNSLSNFDARR